MVVDRAGGGRLAHLHAGLKKFPFLRTAVTALIVWTLLVLFPHFPGPGAAAGLDTSWVYGLNMAHAKHLVFGRDVAFTYGPLTYLMMPTFPEANAGSVACYELFVFSVLAYALLALQWRIKPALRASFITVPLVLMALLLQAYPYHRLRNAYMALAILILADSKRIRWPEFGVLSLLSSVMLLTKFNIGVESVLVLVAIIVVHVVQAKPLAPGAIKKIAAVASICPLTFLLLYYLNCKSILGAWLYLRASLEMASHYTEAMSTIGSDVKVAAGLFSVLCVVFAVPALGRSPRSLGIKLLPVAILCYFVFKENIVRHHGNLLELELVSAACLLLALGETKRDWFVAGTISVGLLIAGTAMDFAIYPSYAKSTTAYFWRKPVAASNLHSFLFRAHEIKKVLTEMTEQNLKALTLDPAVVGALAGHTVDVIPWDIAYIRANHLNWQPRPVLQSYGSYSPMLDGMDAAELRGSKGPERILLNYEDLDARNVIVETPLTTRVLLSSYRPQICSGGFCVLERKAPVHSELVPISREKIRWNRLVAVPPVADGELVLLKANIKRSIAGAITDLLFRTDPVTMTGVQGSGERLHGRILPANFASGAIVNAWPRSLEGMIQVWNPASIGKRERIVSIALHPEMAWEFKPEIEISWYRWSPAGDSPTSEATASYR